MGESGLPSMAMAGLSLFQEKVAPAVAHARAKQAKAVGSDSPVADSLQRTYARLTQENSQGYARCLS